MKYNLLKLTRRQQRLILRMLENPAQRNFDTKNNGVTQTERKAIKELTMLGWVASNRTEGSTVWKFTPEAADVLGANR